MEVFTTELFDTWFGKLKDRRAALRIQARIDRAEDGNFGDHHAVGKGVSEMRIDYGPGYRIYYTMRGRKLVILLAGGDKATQSSDIKAAQALADSLRGGGNGTKT
ncbi:type II toxin-antitoxin system RelE/ParE family toxin [Duganella sp. FT92W]|uniref:Type II toxin-antitoxin system RelE/ParE family toxin n=1 Tax=Pseudoduganella rivuli TaxID=2666085 RepID=A0A7X2ILQ1_9BURK|nr:type II toxin-antitoxin system RelE/ParE family toxin [Pseudoduganella rivuli]MRV72170.1 type II toxin-antitoxin system RelE/ParE family toxin [Pseudoduganella rivuli]